MADYKNINIRNKRATFDYEILEEFIAIEQQFAVALWGVVITRTPTILGHVHATNPHLATLKVAVAIRQRGLAQTNRLDLGAHQHDTCDELLEDLVIEGGTFVSYIYIPIVGHNFFIYIFILYLSLALGRR